MNTQLGWTNLDQSKNLVEAGLNPNTADMCYDLIEESEWYGFPKSRNLAKDDPIGIFVPCWSLGRLMYIAQKAFNDFPNDFELYSSFSSEHNSNADIINTSGYSLAKWRGWSNPIEMWVAIVEYILKKGFIKKDFIEKGE